MTFVRDAPVARTPRRRRLSAGRISLGAVVLVGFTFPWISDPFKVQLLASYLALSLVALSIDLIWGYTGIISIGQFAFFGIGGYATALITNHASAGHFWVVALAFAAAIIVPGIVGALVSWLFFTLRLGELFVLVTIALAVVLSDIATSQTGLLGGIDGINLPEWAVPLDVTPYYYVVAGCVLGSFLAARSILGSSLGSLLTAIKENENRVRHLGYNTLAYKVGVFSVSAALCGLAGALYVTLTGFVTPEQLGFGLSFDAVVWAVIGGLRSLWGPIVGALAVSYAHFYASDIFVNYWVLILGALFISAVVIFPSGFAGLARRLRASWSADRMTSNSQTQEET